MLRLGIVDFDSSHSIEFTRRFNHVGVERDQFVEGARVEVGCPGSSSMAPERIAGFTKQIAACGVELVDTPEQLLGRVDAVLILSLCGQAHLERAAPFLQAGIPTFVDKPFTCSVADAVSLIDLAERHGALLYSSSALPFAEEVLTFNKRRHEFGALHGALSYGPAHMAAENPGLFHYGLHAVSILYALMGPGCRRLSAIGTDGADLVAASWNDGRTATLRGARQGATAYGFLAFCERGVLHQPVSARYAYRNLCRSIVDSCTSGQPAVPNHTTLEIVRFIAASLESGRRGGEFVPVESLK